MNASQRTYHSLWATENDESILQWVHTQSRSLVNALLNASIILDSHGTSAMFVIEGLWDSILLYEIRTPHRAQYH